MQQLLSSFLLQAHFHPALAPQGFALVLSIFHFISCHSGENRAVSTLMQSCNFCQRRNVKASFAYQMSFFIKDIREHKEIKIQKYV